MIANTKNIFIKFYIQRSYISIEATTIIIGRVRTDSKVDKHKAWDGNSSG